MIFKTIISTILSILLIISIVPAQEYEDRASSSAVQFRTGLNLNRYSSDFSHFNGLLDCSTFKEGSGKGFTLGIGIDIPMGHSFSYGLSVAFIDRSGSLSKTLNEPIRDINSGSEIELISNNILTSSLGFIEIAPEINATLFENFISGPLRIGFAATANIPVISSFEQNLEIISPSDAFFQVTGNKRFKKINLSNGDFKSQNSIIPGLRMGIENLLSIGSRLHFSQRLSFDYLLTDILNDANWKVFAFKIELGMRYSFQNNTEISPIDRIIPENEFETIEVSIDIPQVDIEFIEASDIKVRSGTELIASIPLVNSVFFEDDSWQIPPKYILTGESPSRYGANMTEHHKYILLEIAKLLKMKSEVSILLYGSTSGLDNEPEGLTLARKRTESIKQALLDLGVPETNITQSTGILPAKLSNMKFQEGIEENRRVDLVLKDIPLLNYVSKQNFKIITGNARFKIEANGLEGNAKVMPSFSTEEYKVSSDETVMIPFEFRNDVKPLNAKIEYRDISKEAIGYVDMDMAIYEKSELDLSKFEAVLLFDYNSAELKFENEQLLAQLVDLLPNGSTITILGSTDELGTEERNRILTTLRAESAMNFINDIAPEKFNIQVKSSKLQESENSPEGRFLNRSIRIRIEK